MPTLLQKAKAMPKGTARTPKTDHPEVAEVFRAFLEGEITCAQAAKVFDTTPSAVHTTTGQFLFRAYKAGRLVWKKS